MYFLSSYSYIYYCGTSNHQVISSFRHLSHHQSLFFPLVRQKRHVVEKPESAGCSVRNLMLAKDSYGFTSVLCYKLLTLETLFTIIK